MWVELFHVDGRTDGHDEANIRLSQFWEGAYNRCQSVQQGVTEICTMLEQYMISTQSLYLATFGSYYIVFVVLSGLGASDIDLYNIKK